MYTITFNPNDTSSKTSETPNTTGNLQGHTVVLQGGKSSNTLGAALVRVAILALIIVGSVYLGYSQGVDEGASGMFDVILKHSDHQPNQLLLTNATLVDTVATGSGPVTTSWSGSVEELKSLLINEVRDGNRWINTRFPSIEMVSAVVKNTLDSLGLDSLGNKVADIGNTAIAYAKVATITFVTGATGLGMASLACAIAVVKRSILG